CGGGGGCCGGGCGWWGGGVGGCGWWGGGGGCRAGRCGCRCGRAGGGAQRDGGCGRFAAVRWDGPVLAAGYAGGAGTYDRDGHLCARAVVEAAYQCASGRRGRGCRGRVRSLA